MWKQNGESHRLSKWTWREGLTRKNGVTSKPKGLRHACWRRWQAVVVALLLFRSHDLQMIFMLCVLFASVVIWIAFRTCLDSIQSKDFISCRLCVHTVKSFHISYTWIHTNSLECRCFRHLLGRRILVWLFISTCVWYLSRQNLLMRGCITQRALIERERKGWYASGCINWQYLRRVRVRGLRYSILDWYSKDTPWFQRERCYVRVFNDVAFIVVCALLRSKYRPGDWKEQWYLFNLWNPRSLTTWCWRWWSLVGGKDERAWWRLKWGAHVD
jgi:hypothetical protein